MSIVKKFQDNLKSTYFYELKNVKNIKLEEKKGESYFVEFSVAEPENHFLIIKDIEDLKMKEAKYLINKPQDCDYIILDLNKKIVYFFELKNTDITNVEFAKQLNAGEMWLSHLLFCCKCEDEDFILTNPDWTKRRIGVRYYSARPARSARSTQPNRYRDVLGKELLVLKGEYFHLDSVRRFSN